jgi:tetratricopeptide (TPR) repeat protein
LAVAFFLVLRHYPDVVERKPMTGRKNFFDFTKSLLAKRKKKQIEAIKKEIETINEAAKLPEISIQQKYHGLQPEIARLLCSADEALIANDLREAENKSIEVITKDKRSGEAYVIMGKVAFSRGEYADSKEAFETALKCNPELAEAYFGLGQINIREENYQDSIANFTSAVSFEKGKADWYVELGRAYMGIRQFAKAAKSFKKAAGIDIENREYKDLATEAEEKQRAHASVARMK